MSHCSEIFSVFEPVFRKIAVGVFLPERGQEEELLDDVTGEGVGSGDPQVGDHRLHESPPHLVLRQGQQVLDHSGHQLLD